MNIIDTFGNRVKRLRMEAGLSQEAFAAILGVDRSAVSCYERDERQPQFNVLIHIASLCKVSVDYLLGVEKNYNVLNTDGLTIADIETLQYIIKRMVEANKNRNI